MTAAKTILVTGANGQLGKELGVLGTEFPQYHFLLTSRAALPIEDFEAVNNFFSTQKIDFCINCAAYTAVDKAETASDEAYRINAAAAGHLATVCKNYNTTLVHISTDYVFDGNGNQPYKETDPVHPVSVYGASKLKGEELVIQNNPDAIIIRTSWVYSQFGNNFVKTMLRLMKERESINVVNDQLGCPTYAADLAGAIMTVIEKPVLRNRYPSIFHYCNEGVTSWYEFAVTIKELTGSKCQVKPIPTSQYPTAAKRPHYSVLDTALIKDRFGITIPGWKQSLEKCLQQLQ